MFFVIFLTSSTFIIPQSSFGQKQSLCPPSQNKKAVLFYEKALSARKSSKDYETIKELCEKALEEDSTYAEVYHLLGDVAFRKKDFKTMKASYAAMIELCPDAAPEPHYRLGAYLFETKKYDESVKYLKGFLDFGSVKESLAKDAELMIIRAKLISNPVPFNPEVVKGISTSDPEYLAAITADNDYCYFTRRFEMSNKSSLTPVSVEKFMVAKRQADGTFEKGSPMALPFNFRNTNNEGGPTITIDNQHLFFTVNNGGNFDIYYSDFIKESWTKPESLGNTVNDSVQWDSQPSITSDGKILYFASYRDSTFGTSDIFITGRKNGNGSWSRPVRLNDNINTNGNEKTPFIHPDGKTLYFSSDSLPGMGGQDIFVSKKDASGNWGKAVNIGYPINTENDEVGFFTSTDGKTGYFASNNIGGTGGYDLYSFEIPQQARAEKVLMVSGHIRDDDNEIPYAAKIELKNITTNEITDVEYDTLTGKYASVVLFNNDYIMTVKKDSAAFTSKYFEHADSSNAKPVKVNLDVKRIELGKAYTLNDILFDTDSYELKEMSKHVIKDFSEFLSKNPRVRVAIHGHTDNVGNAQENLTLSDNRAKAVYNFLIQFGISTSRLSYKGFGQTKPEAGNDTEEGRARNRRTEFVILSK